MKITEIDMGWNAIVKELKKLDNTIIEVGVLENAPKYKSANMASVAFWNEHGTKHIPPAPVHAPSLEGKHLINLIKKEKELIDKLESKNGISADKVANETGKYQAKEVKQMIIDIKEPHNKDTTIKRKGKDDRLVDKGIYRDNIDHRVKK